MAQFPKKITDDPYAAAVLIRRLVTEQGFIYWRRYLVAFALMALAAVPPRHGAGTRSVLDARRLSR